MNTSQSKNNNSKFLRYGVITLVILGMIVAGVYYGIGYYVFDLLSNAPGGCRQPFMQDMLDNTPDDFSARHRIDTGLIDVSQYQMPDFEDVRFSARGEDVTLAGFLINGEEPSENVVIIVHGIDGCRREPTELIPAGMLANNGFDVFVIDLRNHGDSDITNGRMAAGNVEFRDVLGAIDYLRDERGYENENIGLMGVSLGTGATTAAFAAEPEIPALFLESPYSSVQDMVVDQFQREGIPSIFIAPTFQVALWNGVDYFEVSPDSEIIAHNNRSILINHGDSDLRIPLQQAEDLHALAGPNAELSVRPGLDHVEAIYNDQANYEAELVAFFTEHLGE